MANESGQLSDSPLGGPTNLLGEAGSSSHGQRQGTCARGIMLPVCCLHMSPADGLPHPADGLPLALQEHHLSQETG